MHPAGDIPLDEAALIEPLSVGHHAYVRSGAAAGDVALIGGAGPIGLLIDEGFDTLINRNEAAWQDPGVAERRRPVMIGA